MDILQNLNISSIVTLTFGVVSAFGVTAGYLIKFKNKATKVIGLVREALELLQTLEDSMEDNKLSREEVAQISKEIRDVKDAYLALTAK